MLGEQSTHLRRLDRAAAEGDDRVGVREDHRRPRFPLAKARLAVTLEDLGDRQLERLLDLGVEVEGDPAEALAECGGERRLPGAHEPDDRDALA